MQEAVSKQTHLKWGRAIKTHIPQFAVAFFAIFLVEKINEREFLDNAS